MNMVMHKQQGGAALVVGLILLVVVTVLAVSGMRTATTELAIARNERSYENAFQAAETGLEDALSQNAFSTGAMAPITRDISGDGRETVTTSITYEGATIVPDQAFSLGSGTGISAYHFLAEADAVSRRSTTATERDSTAEHSQAFYIVGPGSSSL